jgi:hypothetical protein
MRADRSRDVFRFVLLFLAFAVSLVELSSAQAPLDFTGTYIAQRPTSDVPLSVSPEPKFFMKVCPARIEVAQSPTGVIVTRFFDDDRNSSLEYLIDGKEHGSTSAKNGRYRAKLKHEKLVIDQWFDSELPNSSRSVSWHYTEQWSLSPDRGTLMISEQFDSQDRLIKVMAPSKLIFSRK